MKSNSGKFSVKFFVGILTFGIILGIIGAYYFGSLDFLKKLSPSKSTSSVIIKSFPPSFADLVDTVSPAVVNISSTKMAKSPYIPLATLNLLLPKIFWAKAPPTKAEKFEFRIHYFQGWLYYH